jgi:membrane AbrB-like protein
MASSSNRSPLSRLAETLLVGAVSGMVLGLAGLPAGWLAGAMIGVAIVALAGRPVHIPHWLGQLTFIVTGISLGGAVTPETLTGIATWPLSILALSFAMVVLTASVALYLRHVHGWDGGSAVLGACPGALSTVIMVAIDRKADVRGIAVVQTVRVVLLVAAVPAILSAFGIAGAPPPVRTMDFTAKALAELGVLFAVGFAAAIGMQWMRFPGALIFGSMISSAALHGTGLIATSVPNWVAIAAFVTLGALTGTRFAGMDLPLLRRLALASLGSFFVGAVVAMLGALLAAKLLSLNVGDTVLAYAPGAIEAMMILALALHFDPAFVAAHHLWRFLMVLVALPLLSRYIKPAKLE